MLYKGLVLDQFQQDAINAIQQNHSVVVSAPTGSGKTLIADFIISMCLEKGVRAIYTAPIKALSNQKYREFSTAYGEERVGLLTGDITKNARATILIMTTEIYRNMVMTNDPLTEEIAYIIFDEIHYLNDPERGHVWEESIIFSKPQARFLCLSATIPNADEFASWIRAIHRHPVQVVKHDERYVPLHKAFFDSELGITTLERINDIIDIPDYGYIRGTSHRRRPRIRTPSHIELVKEIKNKLPCFFFTFSRQRCQDFALQLVKTKMFTPDARITLAIRQKLEHTSKEINALPSTQALREVLPYGIGFHHAGLIPIIKELVEELFGEGLLKVLYTTETFAVGINMPAKTVCFESLRKFDGINFRFLNSKEYFQIAGRAGRRGIDTEGFVYAMIDRRDFEYKILKNLTAKDTEPIQSQFRLSVNTVLNLIDQYNQEEIDALLCKSFNAFQKYGEGFDLSRKDVIYNAFNNIRKRLVMFGYLQDDVLTDKGRFCTRIYADEMSMGEIFATNFWQQCDGYQLLLLLACLCYESREKTEFRYTYPSKTVNALRNKLRQNEYLANEERFNNLLEITALIQPCYTGKTIFEIMKNTTLLEGDLIRFFGQILDRINQLMHATEDRDLITTLENCQKMIIHTLQDIDQV